MSSSQRVSWFRFVLLWFVISKWNFLQSALIDWPWAERFVFILRLTIMFVGICSASTVWGRHGAIFMSHPTTILNACQQRKYYLKREKSLWCASACRDFCEFWKLCPLVRNGVRLHSPPLPSRPTPCLRGPPIARKQFCSFSGKVCHLVLAHSFAGRCVYIKGSQTERWNVTRVKYKVDSIFLKLGDASDL